MDNNVKTMPWSYPSYPWKITFSVFEIKSNQISWCGNKTGPFSCQGSKPLHRNTVADIAEVLPKIKGMSAGNVDRYKTTIFMHNITGSVLSDCDMMELRPVLEMTFGDWQLFKSTVLGAYVFLTNFCSLITNGPPAGLW